MEYAIINDPKHVHLPGTIVDQATASKLKSRGVALLPVNRAALYRGPATGLAIRSFGDDGLQYDANQANRNAHVLLRVEANQRNELHWVAVAAPIRPDSEMRATFKFVPDSSQGFPTSGGVQVVEPSEFPSVKAPRVLFGGISSIHPANDGLIAMLLHGIANNVRVLALGVSVL